MPKEIRRILIANRGEIAVRVIRTCRRLGISPVVVYSSADRNTPAVKLADAAVEIGPAEAAQSYLNMERIVAAARELGADAVHPGYGFLSENTKFAALLEKEGIVFIGPRADSIEAMGDKIASRKLMEKSGVPVVPGYNGENQSEENLREQAKRIGFPVMVKASAGGGGKGMRRIDRDEDFVEGMQGAKREAKNAFGDDTLLIEKFVERPRHIEIQVFGDSLGNVVHVFERECSIQRRHQKIIEESPSPAISEETRKKMADAAVQAARAVNYLGAGTVEFIYSDKDASFYFLEMNTRLQVEHPVTEMVTGRDLVEEQIRVASGLPLSFKQSDLKQSGHAMEVRLYAEDPARNFLPAVGPVHHFTVPEQAGLRVDAGIESGGEVSIYYDPMIAKIITHGPDRASAIDAMERALKSTIFFGPATNLEFLSEILGHPAFRSGKFTTEFIAEHFPSWRGSRLKPDDVDIARLSLGLAYFNGGRHAQSRQVVEAGGEYAPWQDFRDFRMWEN